MKCFSILFLILGFFTISSAQEFITDTVKYKYKIATSEPDTNWRKLDFDDSSWQEAIGPIGFGYHDSTIITPFSQGSLLLRIPFDVQDVSTLNEVVLMSDFDDAFVAYINGVEVARVNLGKKGEIVSFNRLSDRSNESFFLSKYYYNEVPGLALDLSLVKTAIKKGKNILTVQVHNDSINGSDFTYQGYLYNLPPEYYNNYGIESRYYQQVELPSSKFPIVLLNTDEFYMPNEHVRYMAQMQIVRNPNGINHPEDLPRHYSGFVHLERRGESSSDFPKWSFNVETVDKDTNSIDTAIMGMPNDNDWILAANYPDKSMLRNELCSGWARSIGNYVPRTQYCELIYNGEFQGLYVFAEKIKRGRNRVYVAKKPETGVYDPEDIGYVFKYDKPNSTLQFIYPNKDNITKEQESYIANYMKKYFSVLKSTYFNNPDSGYKKYIVPSTLIDFVIINELAKNPDAYKFSTYLYKEGYGSRVKFGPIWDNDLSFGNSIFQEGNLTTGWQFNYNKGLNIHYVMKDPEFATNFNNRWSALRAGILKTDNIFKQIDSIASYIEDARVRNYSVWHTIDKQVFYPAYEVNTYEDEITQLKSYIEKRAKWIDQNISSLITSVGTIASAKVNAEVYPNPCVDQLHMRITAEDAGNYVVMVKDMNGRLLYTENFMAAQDQPNELSFNSSFIQNLKTGMYFINIVKDGSVVSSVKFVKNLR